MWFELHRLYDLGRYPDSHGMYVGIFGMGVLTLLVGFGWRRFLGGCLQNYPGRVPLWIWREDHPEKSIRYTVVCALACAWSMKRGCDCFDIYMPAMAVFYFGCTTLWLSLRAVVLAKLPAQSLCTGIKTCCTDR